MEPLLDIGQVSRMLRVSRQTIWRLCRDGRLRRVRLGSRTLFHPDDVNALVNAARSTQEQHEA